MGHSESKIRKDYKREQYLAQIRKGARRGEAARAIGVNHSTAWRWVEIDPEFGRAVADAEAEACEPLELVLYKKALGGDFKSLIFWLMNRHPSAWSDKRATAHIEVAVPPKEDIRKLADELLEKLKEMPEDKADTIPYGEAC